MTSCSGILASMSTILVDFPYWSVLRVLLLVWSSLRVMSDFLFTAMLGETFSLSTRSGALLNASS
mgnify:CR=1 FL=1